ncbi:MAG: phosphoenolpyruvate carboxykinase domain-containing protein, partial [Varibaculum sp.]
GQEEWDKMFAIDPDAWLAETEDTEKYFSQFGDKLPKAIADELTKLRERLQALK